MVLEKIYFHVFPQYKSMEAIDSQSMAKYDFWGMVGMIYIGMTRYCYRPTDKKCLTENYFSYFPIKTYVVGIQKNRLNETVLLSTQNTCFNWWVRK